MKGRIDSGVIWIQIVNIDELRLSSFLLGVYITRALPVVVNIPLVIQAFVKLLLSNLSSNSINLGAFSVVVRGLVLNLLAS